MSDPLFAPPSPSAKPGPKKPAKSRRPTRPPKPAAPVRVGVPVLEPSLDPAGAPPATQEHDDEQQSWDNALRALSPILDPNERARLIGRDAPTLLHSEQVRAWKERHGNLQGR
jgi:hypothetical protein